MKELYTHAGVTLEVGSPADEHFRMSLSQAGQSIEIPLGDSACIRLMAELQAHLNTDNSYIQRESNGQVTAVLDGAPLLTGTRAAVRKHIRERIRALPGQVPSEYEARDMLRKLSRLEAEI